MTALHTLSGATTSDTSVFPVPLSSVFPATTGPAVSSTSVSTAFLARLAALSRNFLSLFLLLMPFFLAWLFGFFGAMFACCNVYIIGIKNIFVHLDLRRIKMIIIFIDFSTEGMICVSTKTGT